MTFRLNRKMSGMSDGQRTQITFTIEQIELIRRLRNSGLTKEQVVQAFESFERVDAELGELYNVPVSLSQQKSFTAACSSQSQAGSHSSQHSLSSASHQHNQQHPTAARHTSVTTSYSHFAAKPPTTAPYPPTHQLTTPSSHHNQTHTNGNPHSNSNSPPATTTTSQGHGNRLFQAAKRYKPEDEEGPGGKDAVTRMSMQDMFPDVKSVNLHDGVTKEVEEFLKKGAEEMHAEIHEFLFSQPSVTHNEIATVTGVSVTCVSKFLVGNFTALPSLVLRKLSQWFVMAQSQQSSWQHQRQIQHQQCNSQTSKLLQDIIQERLNSGASATGNGPSPMDLGVEKMDTRPGDIVMGPTGAAGMCDKDGIVGFSPRRERFTFRKKHLEILETCFNTNQYPTYEERTDIAQRCNDVMELTSGRGLGEKEKMTPQNVAYWFSNRRKDVKRMAREGRIEMSEVVLPSRVKQSPPQPSVERGDTASPYWATAETSSGTYSPLDMPSVGPVAFPTTTAQQHQPFSETSTTNTNTSHVTTTDSVMNSNSVSSSSSINADSSTSSADVLGYNFVSVKVEPHDPDLLSDSAVLNGRGSTVERIAEEISSNLRARTSASSTSETEGQAADTNENQDSSSLQENIVKVEVQEEPESH